MARILIILAIVLISGAVSFFTVSTKDVQRFNDSMVDTVTTVDSSFQQISPFVDEYSLGKTIDVAKMESAIASVGQLIEQQSGKIAQAKVPDKDVCRSFHQSLVAYVDNNRAIHQIYAGTFVAHVKAHNPGGEQDIKEVKTMFEAAIAKDEGLMADLQAKQKSMAAQFKLTLQ